MSKRKRKHYSQGNQSLVEIYGKLGPAPVSMKEPEEAFSIVSSDVTACSRAPRGAIRMENSLWYDLITLCSYFKTEWMGFLVGTRESDRDCTIHDIYFPPQDAGQATVNPVLEAPEYHIEPHTIGSIHSHVSMSARFSKTDIDHANWPVEIVINDKAEYEATTRLTLPCGEFMRARSLVHLIGGQQELLIGQVERGMAQGKAALPPQTVFKSASLDHVQDYRPRVKQQPFGWDDDCWEV